jgi:hypothetical protein
MTTGGSGWPPKFWKVGFDGRTFLSEEEWRTYLCRPPVRRCYIDFQKVQGTGRNNRCTVCNGPDSPENPLQAAHVINALSGVRYFALTPDFLDHPDRLAWAHRQGCNRKVELDFTGTMEHLWRNGVRSLPSFLPRAVRSAWATFSRSKDTERAAVTSRR